MYIYIYIHMYVWAYTNTLSCRIPEIDFVEISWKLFKHGLSAGHPCPFAESGHPMTGDLKPSSYGMGPPVDSVQLVYKWLNSMVYGRYNELVNGDSCYVKPSLTLPKPWWFCRSHVVGPSGPVFVDWVPSLWMVCPIVIISHEKNNQVEVPFGSK